MIRPVYSDECPKEVVANFVANRVPNCSRGFDNYTAIGVVSGNKLIGGVIFHDYAPEQGLIEISAASDSRRWLNRGIINAVFSYTFDQIGCQMVVMRTNEDNQTESGRGVNRFSKSLGFEQIRIPRLYGRNTTGILHLLTEERWRQNAFYQRTDNPRSSEGIAGLQSRDRQAHLESA